MLKEIALIFGCSKLSHLFFSSIEKSIPRIHLVITSQKITALRSDLSQF